MQSIEGPCLAAKPLSNIANKLRLFFECGGESASAIMQLIRFGVQGKENEGFSCLQQWLVNELSSTNQDSRKCNLNCLYYFLLPNFLFSLQRKDRIKLWTHLSNQNLRLPLLKKSKNHSCFDSKRHAVEPAFKIILFFASLLSNFELYYCCLFFMTNAEKPTSSCKGGGLGEWRCLRWL